MFSKVVPPAHKDVEYLFATDENIIRSHHKRDINVEVGDFKNQQRERSRSDNTKQNLSEVCPRE